MGLKEQPLIDAVSNVDALPRVLTSNEIVSGTVAATACGFFGGLVMLFQASVVGGGAETLFEPVRLGAICGHLFALVAMLIGWCVYALDPDEDYRRRYAVSGMMTAITWILLWVVASEAIYRWLLDVGPLVGS